MAIDRRNVLVGAGGLVLAAGSSSLLVKRTHARPRLKLSSGQGRKLNILLIVTDQERHGSLLPKGLRLPNRDRLYARATRFSNMNSISGLCSIARGNIYTGQHYQQNGVYENVPVPFAHDLYPDIATLGTMMQDAGYETAYFGKWHLTNLPRTDLGPNGMRALFQSYGFDVSNQSGEVEGPQQGYAKDAYTATAAASYIRSRKGVERPWFASVNLLNPHDISFFLATRRQYETYVNLPFADFQLLPEPPDPLYQEDLGLALPPNFGSAGDIAKPAAHHLYRIANDAGFGGIPEDDLDAWRRYENYYLNCLRDVDRQVGVVLDAMDASGGWSDTVVVFTSDHGEMSGAHGLRGKGNVIYRENASVPFAIIHPDSKTDSDTPALASHIDIAPTLIEFAGVSSAVRTEQAPWLKGHDLTMAMGRGAERTLSAAGRGGVLYQWDSRIFGSPDAAQKAAEAFKHQGLVRAWKLFSGPVLDGLRNRHGMRGAFDGRWKFARYFRPNQHNKPGNLDDLRKLNDLELYDTLADPTELVNIAGRQEAEAELLRMSTLTNRLMDDEIGPDDVPELPGPSFLWNA
jgi:arylsulfatase A-like enzyme